MEWFSLIVVCILLVLMFVSFIQGIGDNNKPSEYELYGPDGADDWERKQMGLSREEYELYSTEYQSFLNRNKEDETRQKD